MMSAVTILHVRVRAPSGALSFSTAESSSFGELRQRIEDDLKLTQDFDLLIGFPPVVLTQDDEECISGIISNNENIRVQLKELSGVQVQGVAKKKRKAVSSSAASKEPPPTFKFGANVHSIKKTDTVSSSFLVSSPQQRSGESSRLVPKPKRQRRSSRAVTAGSETDICEDLMAAINGGTGNKNKMLRKALRNTVLGQYNESKAISRLGSIYSNKYQIAEKTTSRVLNSGVSTQIEVTFPKGAGNRGFYCETVDLLPREALILLIRLPLVDAKSTSSSSSSSNGHTSDYVADAGDALEQGREVLKPANLSKCSPRLFWSLVHHFGPDIYSALREILKDIDAECHWLEERKRELSEKAKVNLAQKEELERGKKTGNKKAKPSGSNNSTGSSSSTAVVEVIDLSDSVSVSTSGLTPTAVIASNCSALPQRWIALINSTVEFDSIVPTAWIDPLLALMGIKQPKDGCDSFTLLRALTYLVNASSTRNQLVDLSLSQQGADQSQPIVYARVLPLPQFSTWPTSAQDILMVSFWCEVVCGGSEVLRAALASLRIRTPTELLIWKRGLGGLVQGLLQFNPVLGEQPLFDYADGSYSVLNEARLTAVCEVSEILKAEMTWVKAFEAQPIATTTVSKDESTPAEEEQEEGWTSAHPLVGKRVRVGTAVDDEEQEEDPEAGEYWLEGTVVSYLPPDEEEPTALWKVKMDPVQGNSINGGVVKYEFEYLNEEDLNKAIEKRNKAYESLNVST